MHLLVGGHALCGVTPDARDVYPDGAALRQWNDGRLDRCGACEDVLSRRIDRRQDARRRVAS
jgi:hypothetical protein